MNPEDTYQDKMITRMQKDAKPRCSKALNGKPLYSGTDSLDGQKLLPLIELDPSVSGLSLEICIFWTLKAAFFIHRCRDIFP